MDLPLFDSAVEKAATEAAYLFSGSLGGVAVIGVQVNSSQATHWKTRRPGSWPSDAISSVSLAWPPHLKQAMSEGRCNDMVASN